MKRNNEFGDLIRSRRLELDLTMAELVKLMSLNTGTSYICIIETRGCIPSAHFIIRLAQALSMDPKVLIDCAKKVQIDSYSLKIDKKFRRIGLGYI